MALPKASTPIRFNALRQRREELSRIEGRKLTQEDIADRSGDAVSQRTVSHLEAGTIDLGSIAAARLVALARALKWSLGELQEATGIDLAIERYEEGAHVQTAAERSGWTIPEQEPKPIPEALLDAAKLYGQDAPELLNPRWQRLLTDLNHKKTPHTPYDWLKASVALAERLDPPN